MNSTVFFDAHCHWAATTYGGAGSLVSGEGVEGMVCCGTSPDDWGLIQQAAAETTAVIPAYGLHPWFVPFDVEKDAAVLDRLAALLEADPQAAVGEIGLDFARREGASHERQRAWLLAQLRLAQRFRRVAIIHCVHAWGALVETLEEAGPLPRGCVLHAYAGSAEMVTQLARFDAFFSFKAGGDTPGPKVPARMGAVPPGRLLLESDLHLGREGEGGGLQLQRLNDVAAQLAAATGITREQVARLTAENARRCFGV